MQKDRWQHLRPKTGEAPYWETKTLAEMTAEEWEGLCDGCGICCVVKLEDEDSGAIAYTDIACKLLDDGTCACRNYPQRNEIVSDCVRLTRENTPTIPWLPKTCAYRLLDMGQGLRKWHPLVSGNPESVHEAGISLRGQTVPEDAVDLNDLDDLESHIVEWLTPNPGTV